MKRSAVTGTLALVVTLLAATSSAQELRPNEWLDRMASVVDSLSFEGTVIRRRNGESEALKVVRKVVDGVVQERLVSQEGNGLEIIRNGTEVYCILPDKRSVLVEYWDDDITLFSTLPDSNLQFGSAYDLAIVREERVAGRRAMLLAVRPHDSDRYGHRIWLDRSTAFPLRTELVGADGALLEQLKFADITFDPDIAPEALKPSFDLNSFTWYPEPVKVEPEAVESAWVVSDLPTGFRRVSASQEMLDGTRPVEHHIFSDGLATVSVFIAEAAAADPRLDSQGAIGGSSNTHSVESEGFLITAIGEVPPATVRRIAASMRRR